MAAGIVALVVGLITTEPVTLAVGIGAMMLGVVELTLREHVTGYRSHKLILAAATAVAVHMGLVALAPFRLIGPGALAFDLVLFGVSLAAYDALWKRAVRLRTPAKTSYPRRARR